MSQPIDPMSMTFLHRGQTQAQLVQAPSRIYSPESRTQPHLASFERIRMHHDLSSLLLLAGKKKSLGKFWMFAKRQTPFGKIYVANAVFVLSIGVTAYLIVWDMTALVIASFSFANRSTFEWWWVIPFNGFLWSWQSSSVITASCWHAVRDRLLAPAGTSAASRKKRIYLPISRRHGFSTPRSSFPAPCSSSARFTFAPCPDEPFSMPGI